MASQSQVQASFPLGTALLLMSGVAALIYIVVRLAVGVYYGDAVEVSRAVNGAALVVYVSGIIGVLPAAALARFGLMPVVYGYFCGAAVRVLAVLIATVVAVAAMALPAGPWAVTLFALYLPLLFLEAALVGRFIWDKRLPARTKGVDEVNGPHTNDADSTTRHMEALA